MYESVHARPEGAATVARLATTAREYGFDGVVVRNHGDERVDVDAARVAEEAGVDVVRGVELRADGPESASGYLGNYRPDHTIVAVHGGTTALNRFAAEQPKVDVLAHPMRGDGDVNHVVARAAADNGVRLELNLRDALRETGGTRVRSIQGLRKLWELIDDADAPFVVTADPRSHLELRAPRELRAVGEEVGLPGDAIEDGLAEWHRLAERNRRRQSDAFVEPGVYRGRRGDRDGAADRRSEGEPSESEAIEEPESDERTASDEDPAPAERTAPDERTTPGEEEESS